MDDLLFCLGVMLLVIAAMLPFILWSGEPDILDAFRMILESKVRN